MKRKHLQATRQKFSQRSNILAAMMATFMMFIFGLGYRVLSAQLAAPVDTDSVSASVLERLPLQISDWMGEDVPLDESIVRATDTDAHINRRYSRRNGLESISLYIAGGVRARDLMPHRPEVCYTGAGWTLVDKRSTKLLLADDIELPCNILQFARGALNTMKVVVLDYYIIEGQYCHDVSLLRSKVWRGSGTVSYVAQVQIVASITSNLGIDTTKEAVSDFAIDSALSISKLFKSVEEAHNRVESHAQPDDVSGGAGSD